MLFEVGARRLLISWTPGHTEGFIGDVTGEYQPVGPTARSSFAFSPTLEARIDRRDLGSPESLRLAEINVMVGQCCDYPQWRPADQWRPAGATPVVNEYDPPRLVSDAPRYVLARRFELPQDYVAERLFAPPAPDLVAIVRSQGGTIYLQHGDLSAGISTLNPATGEVLRILDLPDRGVSPIANGPADTAFVGVSGEIWQVRPDGTHTVWGQQGESSPRYYAADGRLIGVSHDAKRVVSMNADGSASEIAAGFAGVFDVVAAADGTIFVSDWEAGSITRVDADGSQHVLVAGVLYRDPMDMEIDPAGDLFLNTTVTGFVKVNRTTGVFTPYAAADNPCTIHQADFVFTAAGRVVFVDPTWSQVTWADLGMGQNGLLVSNQGANTWAAAIGPDDALYVGAWGCGTTLPAQVIRLADDGTRTVFVDNLRGEVRDIAFAADGGLYVAAFERGAGLRLSYVPPDGGVPTPIPGAAAYSILSLAVDPITGHLLATERAGAAVLEFTRAGLLATHPVQLPKPAFDFFMDVAPDGAPYAYVSEAERATTGPVVERWVVRLDLAAGASQVIYRFDHPGCCVMGNLSVDPRGVLWWAVDPEFQIYRITAGGEGTLFARNLPIDPAAVVADRQGDVYFTSPSGIYRAYREPLKENHHDDQRLDARRISTWFRQRPDLSLLERHPCPSKPTRL
jgi:streptogramin lyase